MEMLSCFPPQLKKWLQPLSRNICDIRLLANRPVSVQTVKGEMTKADVALSAEELYETAQLLCERRLRVSPETTGKGFITLRGGHRMGLCGRVTCDRGELTLQEIGSVCIRVAHEVQLCGREVAACVQRDKGLQSIVLAGAPGSGKTTMLRDALRILSENGIASSLCDERGEVAACVRGVPQLDVGRRTHVLDGCPKAEGLRWLVHCMCPQLLAMDELYGDEECVAVREAACCGVKVLATVHASDAEDLCARSGIVPLLKENVFSQVVFLQERKVVSVMDAQQVLEAACCGD